MKKHPTKRDRQAGPDKRDDSRQRAISVFRQHGGLLRTKDALSDGVQPRTLRTLLNDGTIEQLSRGVYRITDARPIENPDLVVVAMRVPNGVICLLSALAFHELTTQIPHAVYLAIPRGTEPLRIDYPPVNAFWFNKRVFETGIERHSIDAVRVRVYSREKTIADCFKYRNKIGLDTVLEALRLYCEQGRIDVDGLMRYAAICRVARVMRPYLEILI